MVKVLHTQASFSVNTTRTTIETLLCHLCFVRYETQSNPNLINDIFNNTNVKLYDIM